ncbi:MAG: TonB-dependent receptor [Gammaproteobacteria bacterium]|nr:TonB-dependent receptor [Gammaproteobacteria bacterium]
MWQFTKLYAMQTILTAGMVFAFATVASIAMAAPVTLEEQRTESDERKDENGPIKTDETVQLEPIVVSARGTAADVPTTLATYYVRYENAIAAPSDFQDWITRVPGVGATGQNGIFETFSLRGLTANEILMLVAGVPITSQRRAGVPLSFVEPYLLGDVLVTLGPAVVHFGPGAMGGAISVEPRWFKGPFGVAEYVTAGDENLLVGGYGSRHWSIGVAHHQAEDSEAPNGTPLDTSYERTSATLQYRHRFGDWAVDALLMPSRTVDIGKSNIRFPDVQQTTYPLDKHTIARVRVGHSGGWQGSVYVHDQELQTSKNNIGEPDESASISSTDGGATLQRNWTIGDFSNDIGIEYFTRRDVTGWSQVGGPANRSYSLDGATANSWSLFAITDWHITNQIALELGARGSTIEQEQSGSSLSDSAAAFSAGAIWTPTTHSTWTVNLASGYRFPTLEERFFTGVTGRGEIVGNPNLSTEHSLGVDVGYVWVSDDWYVETHAYRTRVEDFIQKVEIQPDVFEYRNIGHGDLYGAEIAAGWHATQDLTLNASTTYVRGEDQDGQPLYGIPPWRVSLSSEYEIGKFRLAAYYTHRFPMTRPGPEELSRASTDILDLEVRYAITPALDVELFVRNALDELYYATADDKSTFAQQRAVGVSLVWYMD